MIKRIHVNQHIIKRNKTHDEDAPPLTVKTYKDNTLAHRVEIEGPSELVYRPDDPLSCGARVWIETESPVKAYVGGDRVVILG